MNFLVIFTRFFSHRVSDVEVCLAGIVGHMSLPVSDRRHIVLGAGLHGHAELASAASPWARQGFMELFL